MTIHDDETGFSTKWHSIPWNPILITEACSSHFNSTDLGMDYMEAQERSKTPTDEFIYDFGNPLVKGSASGFEGRFLLLPLTSR